MKLRNKIRIGTVQFGLPYGIANKSNNILSINELECILKACIKYGFNKFDTADNYGEINEKIKNLISKNHFVNFDIQNKILLCKNKGIKSNFDIAFKNAQADFGLKNVKSILIHNGEDLKESEIFEIANIAHNYPFKIGCSTYDLTNVKLINNKTRIRIQIPFNFADQRVKKTLSTKLINSEIQVRSVFLQGLLLMDYEKIPTQFKKFKKFFLLYENVVKKANVTKLQFLLAFVLNEDWIDEVLVGIQSLKELDQLNYAIDFLENEFVNFNKLSIFPENEKLIDPRNWVK